MIRSPPAEAASDPFDLGRFVEAQEENFEAALREIRSGRKRSHWMWYVFPQIAGLGHSYMTRRFAIRSLEEARAFLDHPVLGSRLRACVSALQDLPATTAEAVFGEVDALKLRSSLTLFYLASYDKLFDAALSRWFGGIDVTTARLLSD